MGRKFLLAFFCMLLMTSCYGVAKQGDSDLEARVNERWSALIEGDFATAYEYLTPAYRKLYSLESYKKKLGVSVKWSKVDVVGVKIIDDSAEVKVNVKFELNLPSNINEEIGSITSEEVEQWLRVADNWWLVDLKATGL